MNEKTAAICFEQESIIGLYAILAEQEKAIDSMSQTALNIQDCLIDRDWERLEANMIQISEHSTALQSMENSREAHCAQVTTELGMAATATLRDIAAQLSSTERVVMMAMHRRIRVSSVRLKGIVAGISHYIGILSGTIQGALNELFPGRRLYASNGGRADLEESALVVDRQL